MILLADVHLREESAETVLYHVLPESGQAAVNEGSRELAILGDLLTFRYKIDARIQNDLIAALKWVVALGVNIRIIPGNHDQYEVGGRNALEPLDEIQGVSVYTQPTCDKDGYWLPYRKRPEDITQALELLVKQAAHFASLSPSPHEAPRVLFAHQGVRDAWMNDNIKDADGLSIDAFQMFQKVLLGHYHKRQSVGICQFVGSPYQTKADESGQDKGYAVWNGQDLSYVTMDWGKRYHNLKVDGVMDLTGVRPGDEVRVTTGADADVKLLAEQLQKSGIENHVITPEVEVNESRLDVPENAGLRVYAQAYVDAEDTPLDKDRLMQVFQELMS